MRTPVGRLPSCGFDSESAWIPDRTNELSRQPSCLCPTVTTPGFTPQWGMHQTVAAWGAVLRSLGRLGYATNQCSARPLVDLALPSSGAAWGWGMGCHPNYLAVCDDFTVLMITHSKGYNSHILLPCLPAVILGVP